MTQLSITKCNSRHFGANLLWAGLVSLALHSTIFFQLNLSQPLIRLGEEAAQKNVLIRVLQAKQISTSTVVDKAVAAKKDLIKKVVPQTETASEMTQKKHEAPLGQQTALARYLEEVRLAIESQKYYPSRAKRMRQEGVVEATFTLNRHGVLTELISITGQVTSLNEAVRDLISAKVQFPTMPKDLSGEDIQITLPISFELI